MDWKKLLGSITASVDEELRLRNAYLIAENRMLRQQISGRVPLTDGERKPLAELGQQLGQQALEETLNLSQFVAHKTWRRCGVSPLRGRPHRLQRRKPLRGLLVPMATTFDLLQTAIN